MRFQTYVLLLVLTVIISCCKNKKEIPVAQKNVPATQLDATKAIEPAVGLNLGNAAPEISLKNPAGATINLSSLKGKIVLIDFWASWCGPCRQENPTLVKAYNLYRDKKLRGGNGFTIYSVSLDANEGLWKKAIEKDGLEWETHVSDLKGWDNAAALKYQVSGIPVNFLINGKGIIINKNLGGDALLLALQKLAQE